MRKTQEAYLRHTQRSAQKLREAAETIQTQNVSLEQANRLLRERSTAAMESLSATVDARDAYTAGHSRRVQQLALAIGRELGLSQAELDLIGHAALFHDIGKLAIPDAILLKPASLTAEAELYGPRQAMLAEFLAANPVNVLDVDPPGAWLGIVAAGKTYHDTRQALRDLGLADDDALRRAGIRMLRLGMIHPVERALLRRFAAGLGHTFMSPLRHHRHVLAPAHVPPDRPQRDAQRRADFRCRQPLVTEFDHSTGVPLQRAVGPALILALLLRLLDARRLPLLPVLVLDLGQPQQQRRNHPAHRAVEVELLRHDDDPQVPLRPVGQRGDAVLEAAAESIQFPENDRLDLAVKDVGLQALLHFGPLAVVVLPPSADPNVRRHGHVRVLAGA